ncbi:MAG: DegV family protein [Anaerolinea sp.]|jgi:DegV family protein with EDD domain
MGNLCILTDAATQFTHPGFPGYQHVWIVPYDVSLRGLVYPEGEGIRWNYLPSSTLNGIKPRLKAPDPETFYALFQKHAAEYSHVIAIFSSSELTPIYKAAEEAAQAAKNLVPITLIDSQTISVGVGLLVQMAAQEAAHGKDPLSIEQKIRRTIPKLYTLICTAGLSYLHEAGFLEKPQAIAGEMLNMLPVLSFEEGKISPIEKARNVRGALDFFQEFLEEFEELRHIAVLQGISPFNHETQILRNYVHEMFPDVPFSEHSLNLPTAILFGPRTIGMVILEGD